MSGFFSSVCAVVATIAWWTSRCGVMWSAHGAISAVVGSNTLWPCDLTPAKSEFTIGPSNCNRMRRVAFRFQ